MHWVMKGIQVATTICPVMSINLLDVLQVCSCWKGPLSNSRFSGSLIQAWVNHQLTSLWLLGLKSFVFQSSVHRIWSNLNGCSGFFSLQNQSNSFLQKQTHVCLREEQISCIHTQQTQNCLTKQAGFAEHSKGTLNILVFVEHQDKKKNWHRSKMECLIQDSKTGYPEIQDQISEHRCPEYSSLSLPCCFVLSRYVKMIFPPHISDFCPLSQLFTLTNPRPYH